MRRDSDRLLPQPRRGPATPNSKPHAPVPANSSRNCNRAPAGLAPLRSLTNRTPPAGQPLCPLASDVLQARARGVRAAGGGGRHRAVELPFPQHLQPADIRPVCRQRHRHQGWCAGVPGRLGAACCLLPAAAHVPALLLAGGCAERGLACAPPCGRGVPASASQQACMRRASWERARYRRRTLLLRPGAPPQLHQCTLPLPLRRRCRSTRPGARSSTSESLMRRWRRRAPPPTSCRCWGPVLPSAAAAAARTGCCCRCQECSAGCQPHAT